MILEVCFSSLPFSVSFCQLIGVVLFQSSQCSCRNLPCSSFFAIFLRISIDFHLSLSCSIFSWSIYLPFFPYTCLSIFLSFYLAIYLSIHIFILLFENLNILPLLPFFVFPSTHNLHSCFCASFSSQYAYLPLPILHLLFCHTFHTVSNRFTHSGCPTQWEGQFNWHSLKKNWQVDWMTD